MARKTATKDGHPPPPQPPPPPPSQPKKPIPKSVNFPVKNLELKDYIPLPTSKDNKKLKSKYDLIANIVHDGKPGEGFYRVFVQRKSEELW